MMRHAPKDAIYLALACCCFARLSSAMLISMPEFTSPNARRHVYKNSYAIPNVFQGHGRSTTTTTTTTTLRLSLFRRKNAKHNKEFKEAIMTSEFDEFLEEKRRKKLVADCPLFQDLDIGDQARLVAKLQRLDGSSLPLNEPIVKQGDPGDSMFIVDSGTFQCYDENDGTVLRVYTEGDYFGELSLLFEEKRAASVRPASADARLLKITKKDFETSLQGRQSISRSVVTEDSTYETYFEMKRRIEAVKKCPLFRKMTTDDLDRIVKSMSTIQVQPGEVIINQGEEGSSMYFVGEGSFECYNAETGKILLLCEKFDYFGELALVLQQERAASVRGATNATSTLVLWKLDKADFMDAIQESPLFESAIDLIKEKYQNGTTNKNALFLLSLAFSGDFLLRLGQFQSLQLARQYSNYSFALRMGQITFSLF